MSIIRCTDCDKPATEMFHFRNEGAGISELRHVPRCKLHTLKEDAQAAVCYCQDTWEELLEQERSKEQSST